MRTLRLLTGTLACAMGAAADMIDTDAMVPWKRCAYCHGLDGNFGAVDIPRLGGRLEAFRSGERRNDDGVMAEIARHLTDAQIERVTEALGGESR